jgi:hypothetical protein
MKSFREAIQYSSFPSPPFSAKKLAQQLGIPLPTSLNTIITGLETLTLRSPIVTPDGFPLGGEVEITLRSDGSYTFKGHMRATGFPSYDYRLQCFVRAANGVVIAAQNTGEVFGTDTPGDRQHNWNENLSSPVIREQWNSIRNRPTLEYRLDAEIGGLLGTAWDVLKTVAEAIIAKALLGTTGMAILIGRELAIAAGIQIPIGGALAGVIVTGGSVLVLGPGVMLPAIVAGVAVGAAVESDIRRRSMTPAEIEFAAKVFSDTLPIDRILLTNLSHDGGRKYVIPSIDGWTILVNMGDAYDKPSEYAKPGDYSQPGSLFIHELVHAWQIAHTSFLPGLICKLSKNYDYHTGDSEASRLLDPTWFSRPWAQFNLEQQAHIIDDWYGAYLADLNGDLNSVKALNDPAFRFIRDHIRAKRN